LAGTSVNLKEEAIPSAATAATPIQAVPLRKSLRFELILKYPYFRTT
jgi:hypothetical protein